MVRMNPRPDPKPASEPRSRTVRRGAYEISSERERLDLEVLHRYLEESSYWAAGIPLPTVRRAVQNSLPFGIYHEGALVGFARVITDYATFAYVGDVFVLEPHRGKGLSRWLMETIVADPRLSDFRRWMLATRDAHGLYAQTGFTPLANVERWMERRPLSGGYGDPAPGAADARTG
jgi:GNAT superfamily N-acetyltransferase